MRVWRTSVRHLGSGIVALVVGGCSCGVPVGDFLPGTTEPPILVVPTPTAAGPTTVLPTATASPAATGPQTITSDDGLLTINIPDGALNQPTTIGVTTMDSNELPAELGGLPLGGFGYTLQPNGLTLDEPATVERKLQLPEDFDTGLGVPLILLAGRTAQGAWTWLDDLELDLDVDDQVFTVRGTTTQLNDLFGLGESVAHYHFSQPEFVAGLSAPENTFYVVNGLSPAKDAPEPAIGPNIVPTVDSPSISVGSTQTAQGSAFFQQLFMCEMAGQTGIAVGYDAMNLGGLPPGLGLPPATTTVNVMADVACQPSNPPQVTGVCLTATDDPFQNAHGDFDSTMSLDTRFEQEDLGGLNVVIPGTNNGFPSEGLPDQADLTVWQSNFGYDGDPPVPLGVVSATAAGPDSIHYDVTGAVNEHLGPVPPNFAAGDRVGDGC